MNLYPYDKNGYCVHCRIAQYKPHKPDCPTLQTEDKTRVLQDGDNVIVGPEGDDIVITG
jgi:hypothetical protein